ncbi:MAG: B-box zinc finger protein [Edaphobacter sp.]
MNCANHPDREHVAFCQNCGKPICQECTRAVGSAVFCEPCLVARLAGTTPPTSSGYAYGPPPSDAPYAANIPIPPPPIPGEPNPGLAALLGFIPGVGAMYNGQYAKGIVHLIVFAILVSLASENGIFGLFVAGWIFYQIFEAHQTARARRDGTPLPNPFGLNDLGERLGFGKAWPGQPASAPGATPADPSAAPPAGAYAPPPVGYPPHPPYTQPPTANWNESWNWENHVPPVPPSAYPVDPNIPYSHSRFPSGAIWLIALGSIFLIGNTNMFRGFPSHWLVPLLLIGFGVWQFVRKMTEFGAPLADDGTPTYRFRLFHAIRGAIWINLVGVLFLLDSFHILSWGRSWPLFIIVAGLMAIFHRATVSSISSTPYPPYPPPPAAPAAPTVSTAIVPSNMHDQEGS